MEVKIGFCFIFLLHVASCQVTQAGTTELTCSNVYSIAFAGSRVEQKCAPMEQCFRLEADVNYVPQFTGVVQRGDVYFGSCTNQSLCSQPCETTYNDFLQQKMAIVNNLPITQLNMTACRVTCCSWDNCGLNPISLIIEEKKIRNLTLSTGVQSTTSDITPLPNSASSSTSGGSTSTQAGATATPTVSTLNNSPTSSSTPSGVTTQSPSTLPVVSMGTTIRPATVGGNGTNSTTVPLVKTTLGSIPTTSGTDPTMICPRFLLCFLLAALVCFQQ